MSEIDYIILGIAAFVAGYLLARLHRINKKDREDYLDLYQALKYHESELALRRNEAITKDDQMKLWVSNGVCIHALGKKSNECKYCQEIIKSMKK